MNITEKAVEKLTANATRQQFMDDELTGFGVRVESEASKGKKSFFFAQKLRGKKYYKSLGSWPSLGVKAARGDALALAAKAGEWRNHGCKPEENPFGTRARTTVPTFSECLEAYITNVLQNPDKKIGALNKETAEYSLRLVVNKHLKALLPLPLDQINVTHVMTARNQCPQWPHMQNSIVEIVGRLFRWSAGSKNGKINFWPVVNPAASVERNSTEKRKTYLDEEKLPRFFAQLRKEKHVDTRDVLTLLLASGARKGNVYEMRWQDISFEREKWYVPMSKSGHGYYVALNPPALAVLKRREHEIPESEKESRVYVFPADSASGHITDIKKRWGVFRQAAGIPEVRLHDLRRTKGSYAAMSGESLQKIASMLGHRSMGSTEIYAQLADESIREASQAGDAEMQRVLGAAKKRSKRDASKRKTPKLLQVSNG